ncbi:MAG: chorismate mutase [Lachnospiraceae bacterium]|nr:chorismate mutase [Lachnospiraceae bacterium]
MDLEQLRERIDGIDSQLVRLFEERMSLSAEVAEYKLNSGKAVYDGKREEEKLNSVREKLSDKGNSGNVTELFETILGLSRRRQYEIMAEHGVSVSGEDAPVRRGGGMMLDELLLYRSLKEDPIISGAAELIRKLREGGTPGQKDRELSFFVAGGLIEAGTTYGFEGNLLHAYLARALADHENAFSLASERRHKVSGSLWSAALSDFSALRNLFNVEMDELDQFYGTGCWKLLSSFSPGDTEGKTYNRRIRDRLCELAVNLSEAEDAEGFFEAMSAFYREFGVGKYGLHKAFIVRHNEKDAVEIEPITKVKHIYLEDLIGLELQKQKLIENTEAFIAGRRANNCLLFGDAGTGKSSAVKGILNRYYEDGLRIIELYKHQLRDLNEVMAQVKNRNYRFIIYMDDLSFEDDEIEYKYLKAVIEGGLEKQPENILIYATSNRRHLIHEGFSDKLDRGEDDDIHASDTVQEKLSLSARFGVAIYFGRPDKKEFNRIVSALAERNSVDMPEDELLYRANQWELTHGGMSGRTAQQFIDYIIGTVLK